MPKLGDGTTDAVSRVHDADQEPGYKKVKETREVDPSDVDKFRSALEQRRKDGDAPADSETNELVSKVQKSLLDRMGDAGPGDRPKAQEAADASKDTPKDIDKLHDRDEADEDAVGEADDVRQDLAAPDDPGGAADADAPPAQADRAGAQTPDPSAHRPQADPSAQQRQNDPTPSAQYAQMMNDPQARSGFDGPGSEHGSRVSASIRAAERVHETHRDADPDDPADAARIAEVTGMTPIAPAAGNANIEVSDVEETERSRAHELTDKLASEILNCVSALRVSTSDDQTKQVTVVLAQDVLPDTSFTVSFGHKGLEVKFQTKTPEVADKINRVRDRLENRLRGQGDLDVSIPIVTGGSDDLDSGV